MFFRNYLNGSIPTTFGKLLVVILSLLNSIWSFADHTKGLGLFRDIFSRGLPMVYRCSPDLEQLEVELRAEIVHNVAKTAGHLSSSLGVVELTIALHHVFNTPDGAPNCEAVLFADRY